VFVCWVFLKQGGAAPGNRCTKKKQGVCTKERNQIAVANTVPLHHEREKPTRVRNEVAADSRASEEFSRMLEHPVVAGERY